MNQRMAQPIQSTSLAVLLLLLTAFAAAEDDGGMSMDDIIELVEPFGKGCDSQPMREHIVQMLENREEAEMESKCFRQCLLRQFELMPDGQLQFEVEKTVEMMNMMFPNQEADSRRITGACNQEHIGATEKCEAAHAISMCMLREMRQAEYKIPELRE